MAEQTPTVCWLDECGKDSIALVGGKCSSLGELMAAGIRVPPGYAVTTEGYRQFLAGAGIEDDIFGMLGGVDIDDLTALEARSRDLRQMIEAAPFSIKLEDDIAEYYRQLSTRCSVPAVPVAVRSSATAEDLPDASFAGQQDTFLWVRGVDDLLTHVRKCFSSLFTGRAIAYREKKGFGHRDVAISVGVQKMANSYAAGVLFTLNPSNGDRSTVVINASFGFGEAVVSGEVTPDEFHVNKISMELLSKTISPKHVQYGVDREKQVSKLYEVPIERQTVQSIVDDDVLELARLGKLIEQHYGRPMDVEWAVDADMPAGANIFILQARPETVWSAKTREPVSAGHAKSATEHILASVLAGVRLG